MAPDPVAKLCKVCAQLNTQLLAYPLHPCRNPLPCSGAPIKRGHVGGYIDLGSIDEIKRRRSTCDVCKLIAERLDKEPSNLTGTCRITESEMYCGFTLPTHVTARDPSITHFHLTHASVMFDTSEANLFYGPPLPWDVKAQEARSARYVLHFQAKARSSPEPGDSTSVSLKQERAFLDTIGGRHVGAQVNAQLVRAWLHGCEREHGKDCMHSMQLLVGQYKEPAFVVDVIQSCLVKTPSKCRYVALSYVWGRAAVFKHLLKNTRDLQKTGSLRSLPIPATIRDAMILVHAIGERYLWVDSICIIQDELKMQQEEIMRMGSIYSNALLTIVAAAGDHADSGLPGVRQGSREQAQKVLKLPNCELLTVIDIRNTQSGIDETTWSQRAWTFQERALSNRVLVFSKSQVYWSCRAGSQSEERALEKVRGVNRIRLLFPQTSAINSLSWKSLQPEEYCKLYDDLLYIYRQRRMTNQTDILNAFNGVTEMLAALQNDTFFWGLPESFFSYALTWELTGRSWRNNIEVPIFGSNGSKEMIPIPSWSWGAWSGRDASTHVNLDGLIDGGNDIVRSVIQFDIVDSARQLVKINERPWSKQDPSQRDRVGALKRGHNNDAQSHPPPSLPPLRIGQLRFWTSFGTAKVVRTWDVGMRGLIYEFLPLSSSRPKPDATDDVVHQDFIVIAARGNSGWILLAVEWKDGVAYRVGKTEVRRAEWSRVENKQWRLITLG